MTSKIIVNKGYIPATGWDFDTSIRWRDAKKNRSPKVTNRLERKRIGSTSNCMRIANASKPVVNSVNTARNGTVIIPRYTIERKRECSALITALYRTPEDPQQPAAVKARNIPKISLSAKTYQSLISKSRTKPRRIWFSQENHLNFVYKK
jgi:hypothetical protein